MQNRSVLYNRMMQSERRDTTAATIYIGAFNQEAQRGCFVTGSFWQYADTNSPLVPDKSVEKHYLTWEEATNKLDGSMYFLPESQGEEIYNNGIISESICSNVHKPVIEFVFATPKLDIKGLTIEFAESYPEQFEIETNTGSCSYSISNRYFVTEDVFGEIDYMRIIPERMSHGNTRLRIEKILFGIGIGLTGNKIISMTIKEKTHPISLELPTVDFNFTVDNQDRYFNANSDASVLNFFERGQSVRAYFTQTLEDGSTETINAVNAVLDSTWKDKGGTADFSATDVFYQMDQIYEDGMYREAGITAYDLAVDVFEKSGMTPNDYFLDEYLKDIILHNPLPKDTCANCMLLIANACRCVMRQDREGRVIIKASFAPELSSTAVGEADYSNADQLLDVQDPVDYFDWQQQYNRLDGTLSFKPEGEDYLYAGYISTEMSDEDGYFLDNPVVNVGASAAFSFYKLTLQFGNVYPREAIIHCYNNDQETEVFDIDITSRNQIISHEFMDVDMVQIEFIKADPYNRIQLHRIIIGDTTDFTICRDDMLTEPVTERQNMLKNLVINRTVYFKPVEQSDVYSANITVSQENTVLKAVFNSASIPVSVTTTIPSDDPENPEDIEVDLGAEIVRYSNWYCEIRLNKPPLESTQIKLNIRGFIFKISNPPYVLNVNTTGITPDNLQNPLVDSMEMAERYAGWCAEYYKAKAEYTMSDVIGDPVLESNDLAYYEDEDGSTRLIRIHTLNLKFNGTYNGSSYSGRSV